MSTPLLTVIVHIKSKPGMEERMNQTLQEVIAPTRQESGCITLDLLVDKNDPNHFVLYENWKDRSALDAHFQQPYVKQALKTYEEISAEPIAVMSLEKIG
jgi:quinol monooxygenase YgiN